MSCAVCGFVGLRVCGFAGFLQHSPLWFRFLSTMMGVDKSVVFLSLTCILWQDVSASSVEKPLDVTRDLKTF